MTRPRRGAWALSAGCVALLLVSSSHSFVRHKPRAPLLQHTHSDDVTSQGSILPRLSAEPLLTTDPSQPLTKLAGIALVFSALAAAQQKKSERSSRGQVQRQAQGVLDTLAEGNADREPEDMDMQVQQEDDKEKTSTFQGSLNEADLQEYVNAGQSMTEVSEDELARKGARQVVYKLYPSKKYVLYIAKKNAQKTWTKDGPDGRNIGCLEVQIAIITERIRNSILHVREFPHDFKSRIRLTSFVSRRRRMLDKLAWKDLDSYLKLRSELKIRHIYRVEALIGRLPAYKYATKDRMRYPGRKCAMQLKKTRKFLTTRLANQLRQGKSEAEIHKTQKKIKSRKWLARAYDDAANMIRGNPITEYVDPLNLP